MKDTGERQIAKVPGTLEGLDPKHVQRYEWASAFTYNRTVYDIACGTGYGSLILGASQYHGFDNSGEAVEYADQFYALSETIKFLVADACSMPELAPADVIVSFETIEHIKEPEAFLKWCRGHCKTLLISSPIRGSFGRSRFHRFEWRIHEFQQTLDKYFPKVAMLVQKSPDGIIYPCQPDDKGVAVAICQV